MQYQPPYPQPPYQPPQPYHLSKNSRRTPNLRASFPWTDPRQIAANVQGQVTAEQMTMLKQRPGLLAGCLAYLSFFTLVPSFALSQFEHNSLFLLLAIVPLTLTLLTVLWPFTHNALLPGTMGPVLTAQGEVVWQERGEIYVARTSDRQLKLAHVTLTLPPPGPYHFYYLGSSNLLLSAQPITTTTGMLPYPNLLAGSGLPGHEQARLALQEALFSSLGFTWHDLDANHMGMLSQAQRARLSRQIFREALFSLVAIPVTIALGVAALVLWQQIIFALVCFGLGGVCAVSLLVTTPRKRAELQRGAIQCKESIVQAREIGGGDENPAQYYYDIERLSFRVNFAAYKALINNTRYRVYYLPYTPTLLSIEPLEAPRRF